MLTSVLLTVLMQNPTPDSLAPWNDVPRREKVQIGMPYLKGIHPSDIKSSVNMIVCGGEINRLSALCYTSHVIAIGTFDGVLRYGHIPLRSNSMQQEILYAFRVEKYLKASPSQKYGPWLKIRQTGGPLPWTSEIGDSGIGYKLPDDPIPTIGNRYIVFLKDSRIEWPAFSQFEFVSRKRGDASDIHFFTDELSFSNGKTGKILLQKGVAAPLEAKWSFESGPQLLGKTEVEATNLISSFVGADAARKQLYDANTARLLGKLDQNR